MGEGAIISAETAAEAVYERLAKPPRPRRQRRLLWLLLVAALLGGILVQGPRWAAAILQNRLGQMISSQLNADLEMDSLSYQFPYHITIRNARLVTHPSAGESVQILGIRQLDLTLAKLPLGQGPLVIEELVLHDPAVHLIKTDQGIIGQRGLVKTENSGASTVKLSDMFQLRHFAIEGGKVLYEDRTQPGRLPLVWQDLQIDLRTEPKTSPVYSFAVTVQNSTLARATVGGTFDLDSLALRIIQFALKVKVDPADTQSPLPGPLCDALRQHGVAGVVSIDGWADVPLTRPAESRYAVMVELQGAKASVPEWNASLDRLDMKLRCMSDPPADRTMPPLGALAGGARPLYLNLQDCHMVAGDSSLDLANVDMGIVWEAKSWRIARLSGKLTLGRNRAPLSDKLEALLNKFDVHGTLTFNGGAAGRIAPDGGSFQDFVPEMELEVVAQGMSIQPPRMPLPLENITGGAIHVRSGAMDCQNISAVYGGDRIDLSAGNVLWDDAAQPVRIGGLACKLTLDGQERVYPSFLAATMQALRPRGVFQLKGSMEIARGDDPDVGYKLSVHADDAALSIGPRRLPASAVRVDMSLSPGLVDLPKDEAADRPGLSATLFGGSVELSGQVRTANVVTYQGSAHVANADLAQFAQAWTQAGEPPMKLSGKANLTLLLSGSEARADRSAADNFRARGDIEVLGGNFWEAPIIGTLLGKLPPTKGALTVGQAAGVFEIFDQKIAFERVAVSAPVLGLQGSGEARFDGKLDMKVVAAPLADWRDKLKQTGIPLVSSLAAELAGSMQKLVNSATGNLIYSFRVTGTAEHPEVSTEPLPFLSAPAAAVFGQMIRGGDDRLLETLKNKPK